LYVGHESLTDGIEFGREGLCAGDPVEAIKYPRRRRLSPHVLLKRFEIRRNVMDVLVFVTLQQLAVPAERIIDNY
jgi:hypothetical protein